MKKDLIRKSLKGSQTIEKNNPVKFLAGIPVLFVALFTMFTTGCGLFYDYPTEEYHPTTQALLDDGKTYLVSEVIDGDTIILENGEHIRFLGINTPESGMYFYEEAKEVLEIMVLGKEVILEMDVSDRDMYGRELRYVFQGELFVNLEMVKRGFANSYTYPPDVRFSQDFLEAERYARENNKGLWELSDLSTVNIDIIYDAPGNDNDNINGEYIVLKNTGDSILNTEGWTIKDSGTNIYRFGTHTLAPGSSIVLFSGKGTDGDGLLYWNSSKPVWNNNFDTAYLRDKEGLLIEIYNY